MFAQYSNNRLGIFFAVFAILGAAAFFRVGLLGTRPSFDELYHLLAAQGWLETGRPTILDGEYQRTAYFTAFVASVFQLTGDSSLMMGRLVAVVAGVLIPPILFLWLLPRLGWPVALTAAGFAILWPMGIDEAQTLRFYSWHVLFFLIAAICAFEACENRGYRRAIFAVLSLPFFWAAFYLQLTTVIGVAGIVLWIALFVILPVILARRRKWLILGLVAVLGMASVVVMARAGILEDLWQFYRWVPQWARKTQNDVTFYHNLMLTLYPTLWPLFPVAIIIAYRRAPRLITFCATMFAAVFFFHSFGGMKAERYLSYGMPFFFVIVSVSLVTALPIIGRYLTNASNDLNPTGRASISIGVVCVAVVFALLTNPFFERSLDAVQGRGHTSARLAKIDWASYPDLVAGWPEPEFLITSRELQTILYAGDYDVLIEPSRLTEIGDGSDFTTDFRTGRPVIQKIESIEQILRCHPQGMVVGEKFWWFNRGWGAKVGPLLAATGREFEIRTKGDLVAVRWSGTQSDPSACAFIAAEAALES